MPTFENKFARLTDLPSMPSLLMEAVQQINGKQNLTALVDKIAQDPSMTVRILRIANSPFYGMSREIGSLREAVVLLGLTRIRDMLLSICFSNMLPARHKDFDYNLFWHHSLAVAECARQLAGLSGNNPDFAYTAGLLHDIGDLVIVMLFPNEFSQLIKVSTTYGIAEEQKLLGFDHTTMGAKATEYWNLPQEIQQAIEQHETPPNSATTKSLGLLVYTANLLILEQADESALGEHRPICTALAILNVSIDQAAHCTDSGRQFADQLLTLS
jgi:putative nucleotidyltransferase with HDIG domain